MRKSSFHEDSDEGVLSEFLNIRGLLGTYGGVLVSSSAFSEDSIIYSGNFIVIPIKPRKKMISLRLSEDDLVVIDKFVARHGAFSRTLVLTKLIEAFAEGIRRAGYCVSSVKLVFTRGNSSGENEVSVVLDLNSGEKALRYK